MTDLKGELHRKLEQQRRDLLGKLEGLSEYDLRRPLTPTGTNLLGLVKHLAGVEYVYLGDSLGRPAPGESFSWDEDGSVWEGADMWVTADGVESRAPRDLYRRACAHGDQPSLSWGWMRRRPCRTGPRSAGGRRWGCCSSGWWPKRRGMPVTPTSSGSSSMAEPVRIRTCSTSRAGATTTIGSSRRRRTLRAARGDWLDETLDASPA